MEGYSEPALQGIIPRSFAHIFDAIRANCNPQKQFLVRASYLEIYQEVRRAGVRGRTLYFVTGSFFLVSISSSSLNSVRRFLARPSGVSLVDSGLSKP